MEWISDLVELASSLVEGASEDLITSILSLIKHTLQESNEDGQSEAYNTLSRMLEVYIRNLICLRMNLRLKKNVHDVYYYIYNLACLNYLISFLFQSTEEARKAAYDMLIGINSALQESPFATSDGPYEKLVSMV
ncbi:hypothetical protein C3L33_02031, partial [Rhododendron williamsianum]